MSNYVHSIPGRLRVKTALIKKNSGEAEKVERLLKSIPGVQSLDISLLTGSVLVRYDPNHINADQLLEALTEAGYFEPSKAVTQDEIVHSALTRGGKAVGSLVLGVMEIENPALAILTALI
jgi:copper chaperone CopZ